MHRFVDNANRTWEIAINVATVKRIRGLLDVDLYSLVDDGFKSLSALVSDPVNLADVLFCLCKEQADRLDVTDEDFGRALSAMPSRMPPMHLWRISSIFSPMPGPEPG